MLYDSILARSFSKHEQKKFRYGAVIGCFLIALSLFTVFKPYLGPFPVLNLRVSMGVGLKMLRLKDTSNGPMFKGNISSQHMPNNISHSRQAVDSIRSSQKIHTNVTCSSQLVITNSSKLMIANDSNISQQRLKVPTVAPKKIEPVCNITKRSDFCEISYNIRIEASSATVFIAASQVVGLVAENSSWVIRPYARKEDKTAMNNVRRWSVKSITSRQELPKCTQNHSVPAILFSNGGYAGNQFHDFTDIIIPLYLTSRQCNGEVQFLVTNKQSWWIKKFRELLQKLSNYDIIDIDKETKNVHCFRRGIIGLKRHDKELNIDPLQSPYSMKDFRQFLRSSYSLQKFTAIKMKEGGKKRPRLLIISRKRTRSFTNIGRIAKMARRLGYKVIVAEADMNVSRFAEIVNSCDVLVGVHGAGLTNMVFLPENAVVIQVVPIAVEWVARTDFEEPSKAMNLRYLEYKIKAEESALIRQYPLDHQVLRNPSSIGKLGWNAFRSMYLDKQNVQLDLNRFRGTLLKALELLYQ